MPRYIGISKHAPSECPGANKRIQEAWQKIQGQLESTMNKHGVKVVAGPYHADPAHMTVAIVEAASQDAVTDFLMDSRLAEVQNIELYRATELMEMFKAGAERGTLY
jgi:hypothetical protein